MAFWFVSPRGGIGYGKVFVFSWGRQKCLEEKIPRKDLQWLDNGVTIHDHAVFIIQHNEKAAALSSTLSFVYKQAK